MVVLLIVKTLPPVVLLSTVPPSIIKSPGFQESLGFGRYIPGLIVEEAAAAAMRAVALINRSAKA
jgi:hypothetical protein